MKKYTEKIFFTAVILVFGFLGIAIAQEQEKTSFSDVYTTFTLFETYLEINDYDSAWKLLATPYQERIFNANIDNFKQSHSGEKRLRSEIKDAKILNPNEAELTISRGNYRKVVSMAKENSGWKIAREDWLSITLPADVISKVIQTFNDREDALKNGDYQRAWDLTAEIYQKRRFEGDIDKFKKHYFAKQQSGDLLIAKVEQVKFLNQENAVIGCSIPHPQQYAMPFEMYLMIAEKGEWKFVGSITESGELVF